MLENLILVMVVFITLIIGQVIFTRMQDHHAKLSSNNNHIASINCEIITLLHELETRYNNYYKATEINYINYASGSTSSMEFIDLSEEYKILQDIRLTIFEHIHDKTADSITNKLLYRISNLQFDYENLLIINNQVSQVAKMNRGAELS